MGLTWLVVPHPICYVPSSSPNTAVGWAAQYIQPELNEALAGRLLAFEVAWGNYGMPPVVDC
jgi:hypothetical protein